MRLQHGEVALIHVDDFHDVFLPTRSVGRCHESFQIKRIRIQQQMHHGLIIIGVRATDVGRHQHPMTRHLCGGAQTEHHEYNEQWTSHGY